MCEAALSMSTGMCDQQLLSTPDVVRVTLVFFSTTGIYTCATFFVFPNEQAFMRSEVP